MYEILKNKIFAVVSNWGYPFGGGEEYLYQSAIWAVHAGMHCYWISFTNANNKPYDKIEIIHVDGFFMIKLPGGFDSNVLFNWLKLLKPDIIHHQGGLRKEFYDVCSLLRIEFITGIHFWNGIIDLDPVTYNINILDNSDKHSTNPDFIELSKSKYCTFYSVSKYVSECVKKITSFDINHLAYSSSLQEKYLIENMHPEKNTYVTVINIHKLKGGELLLYLLNELPDVSFLVIQTEYHSEDLDKKIKECIENRNNDGKSAYSIYMERTSNIRFIYSQTKIFLAPSLVDETFCRTVNEAMMNGIPVITSGQGNLKYLVEGAGFVIPIQNKEQWRDTINEIYHDTNKIQIISDKIHKKYLDFSDSIAEKMFLNIVESRLIRGKENNIMILTPWCDQGLGIQSRNYFNILTNNGFNLFIFSIKPYNANTAIELQKDPSEWIVENIYYSPNDREHIKDIEIIEFINRYNIGKCIIPETCWFRIFEIAKLLRDNYVKCYAVPNIEIVRKDEIFKHKYFHKILCNNYLCQKIFNDHYVDTTEYVGYGILDGKIEPSYKKIDGTINFLFIGGMNAFSRKHILEICEAFHIASKQTSNITLTCTIQKTNLLETDDTEKIKKYNDNPHIKFIHNHLKYDDIINLYKQHHVSIQVSKHEGLGIGFYEALSSGVPIITLDTPPHNEIIKDNINGWIIPCYYKKMMDNQDSFIQSAYFNPQILANKMIDIAQNKSQLFKIYQSLTMDYSNRLAPNIFAKRFISALN